jgi:transcriptional regulator with XRE-family HTH domain
MPKKAEVQIYQPPSPEEARALLLRSGYTQAALARYVMIDARTVRRWFQKSEDSSYSPMPPLAFRVLQLLEELNIIDKMVRFPQKNPPTALP